MAEVTSIRREGSAKRISSCSRGQLPSKWIESSKHSGSPWDHSR